ncbi:unnamed protein product [Durusdinium trenchii]|uniref:Uncharacterized protein n=1 Tax=Durusdinium trenchii TaxID=1381693 RepID=A0ABP0NNB2_9DINO
MCCDGGCCSCLVPSREFRGEDDPEKGMSRKIRSGLLLLALVTSGSRAWLGLGRLGRRWVVASMLVPGASIAESLEGSSKVPGAPRVMQSQIRYPEFVRMDGPSGDFSINIPTAWRAQFDDAPGRLIWAVENNAGFNSATLQVARISLSNLLANAGLKSLGDDQLSDWRKVVSTEADLAQALMVLAQQGLSTERVSSYANTTVIQTEIEEPEVAAEASSFLWRARAAVEDFRGSRIVSGRALLRRGIVVFAVATGSERFGAVSGSISSSGFGWEYNNRLVGSLRLKRSAR